MKEAECKEKAYLLLHCCHCREREDEIYCDKLQGRRCLNSSIVHELNSSILILFQGCLYLRKHKYFPPTSICCVCIPHTFFSVPSYFYYFYSPQRQKGRQSVIECCPCLPVEANGSKHWFCLSSPSSEWQAHLCINKLHTDRHNHLYCLL